MRKQFAKSLVEMAERDPRVLLVSGDVGGALFDEFVERFPKRFFNVGLCEQSMVGVAAGLALSGWRPVVYTITPFLIERAFEQVKLDVAQQQAAVGLVGYADYPTYGPSHAELDGPKLMSLLPSVRSSFPKNTAEVEQFMATLNPEAPWFMSLKRAPQ